MQDQIDEITQRLDDNDSAQQDFSDNLDASIGEIQSTIDEQSSSIDELNQTAGQLQFPLTQDTIDLIAEQFPRGTVTLASGSATLTDGRISANTIILYSIQTAHVPNFSIPSTPYTFTPLTYSVLASAGQAVFSSSNSNDTSVIAYLLLT